MKAAFELRADVADDFAGGSVSLPGGEAFDVGAALEEGKGKIVLDPDPKGDKPSDKERERAAHDAAVIEALGKFPALKSASVGDAKPASSTTDEKKGGE